MKRKTNQFISFMLIFVLLFLGCGTNSTTVWAGAKKTSAPTKIVLNAKQETTAVGCSLTLKVQSVKPANASKKVTWSSSNSKIATVSKKGVVKAKKTGTVTITARSAENKKAVAKCKIKVYKATKKMKLVSEKAYTLEQGESVTLKAKVTSPAKGYEPVKWSTKNDKVAKVSRKGKVTAVSAGTTTVIGQSGKKTVKVTITVKEKQAEQTPDTPKSDNGAQDNPSSDKPSQDTPGNDNPKPDEPTPDEPTPSDPTVYTRAEWVHNLVTALGYEATGELNDKVFSDLDGCDQANDILLAASKGVFCLNAGEGNVFRPQDVVTREFAAMTAVNALGIVGDSEFQPSDVEQLSFPMHDSVFVKNNIVALVDGAFMPKQELTEAEREKALQFIAEEVEKSNTIEEKFDVTYTDDVIQDVDQIENAEIDTEQGGFLLPINEETEALTQGNIIFIPYTDYEISNIPFKITETQKLDDKILIKGTVPEFNEVFSRIDIAGNIDSVYSVSANDADDIQQEQFSSEMESDILQSETELKEKSLSSLTELDVVFGDEDKDHMTGSISGCIDSIMYEISATGEGVDAISLKIISNFTVTGKVTAEEGLDKEWLIYRPGKDECIHWSFPIEVNKVPTGFSIEIVPKLYVSAEGAVSVNYKIEPAVGFHYEKGEPFKVDKEINLSSDPEVEGSVAIEAGLSIQSDVAWGKAAKEKITKWFGVPTEYKAVYDTRFRLGLAFEVKQYLNRNCLDIDVGPKITFEIGQKCHIVDAIKNLLDVDDVSVVIGVISQKIDVFKRLGIEPPKLVGLHFENGVKVDKCSYNGEDDGEDEGEDENLPDIRDIVKPSDGVLSSGNYHGIIWKLYDNGVLWETGTYDDTDNNNDDLIAAEQIDQVTGIYCSTNNFCDNFHQYTNLENIIMEDINANGDGTFGISGSKLKQIAITNATLLAATNVSFVDNSELEKVSIAGMNVPNAETIIFSDCAKLTSLILEDIQASNLQDMSCMFDGCESLKELDLSTFDTSQVTDMSMMFGWCSSLKNLNLATLDTSQVTNMSNMFYRCGNLETLDLSKFNTSQVTDMSEMFYLCTRLGDLDVSEFKTENVETMEDMFGGCSSLKKLDLSRFDTSKVTNMSGMFGSCNGLEEIDLSDFNTSQVTDFSYMFHYASGLMQLDLTSFDIGKAENMEWMFAFCKKLNKVNVGSGWVFPEGILEESLFEESGIDHVTH